MKVLLKKEICDSHKQYTDPLESIETRFSMKKKAWNAEHGLHYSRGSHLWKRQTPKHKNRNTIQMGI